MTDIIETIDRLYVKAEKANAGGPPAAYEAAMLELHSALVGNWPALRDRLREAVADILRPEATDAKPLPHGVSPVGKPQPSGDPGQLPTIGQHHPDDPLKTEWTADGFRITQQPEEWRDNFDETHAGICVRSASCPDWCGELWLRGEETETDSDDVRVTAADRPRVWAAICSLNAKHRPKASQPAPAEPSGDRALRLVKRLALFTSRFDMRNCGEARAELDAIIAECDGGGR